MLGVLTDTVYRRRRFSLFLVFLAYSRFRDKNDTDPSTLPPLTANGNEGKPSGHDNPSPCGL
jgi:hypothetical protein